MFPKPLRLDIKRKLTARSDRVKCVDQHPTEPWLLCALYNGDVNIWNYETHTQIKRFEVIYFFVLLKLLTILISCSDFTFHQRNHIEI